MDFGELIDQLKLQRKQLDKAIEALSDNVPKRHYRRRHHKMSAEARKRISAAMKARWAKKTKA